MDDIEGEASKTRYIQVHPHTGNPTHAWEMLQVHKIHVNMYSIINFKVVRPLACFSTVIKQQKDLHFGTKHLINIIVDKLDIF